MTLLQKHFSQDPGYTAKLSNYGPIGKGVGRKECSHAVMRSCGQDFFKNLSIMKHN